MGQGGDRMDSEPGSATNDPVRYDQQFYKPGLYRSDATRFPDAVEQRRGVPNPVFCFCEEALVHPTNVGERLESHADEFSPDEPCREIAAPLSEANLIRWWSQPAA